MAMANLKANFVGRKIGDGEPVYIICEGGVTNYGQLELAKRQVDAAYEARTDIVKFQVWKTENLISKKVAKRLQAEMGYDWFARVKYKEIPYDQIRELAKYVQTGGMPFFATAHEEDGLDFLDKELNQLFFKIGSGESHNYEFLKSVGKRGKPVMISFGLQSDEEILKAIKTLRDAGVKDIVALHCTTLYPTPYDKLDLKRMLYLRELLNVPIGLSDHSVGWHVPLAAVAMGACVIEKHLTFGKEDPRSMDNAGALYPEEFKAMVKQIRDLEKALIPGNEAERQQGLVKGRDWAGQSLMASKDIPAGTEITRETVTFKRPARGGLPPEKLSEIIGKKTKTTIEADEQILLEHFH